jgi:hypothetical protein
MPFCTAAYSFSILAKKVPVKVDGDLAAFAAADRGPCPAADLCRRGAVLSQVARGMIRCGIWSGQHSVVYSE